MTNAKILSPEQMQDAEKLAKFIGALPEERQATVVMAANAFICGMEAQASVTGDNISRDRESA